LIVVSATKANRTKKCRTKKWPLFIFLSYIFLSAGSDGRNDDQSHVGVWISVLDIIKVRLLTDDIHGSAGSFPKREGEVKHRSCGKKDVPACGPDSYLKVSVPTGRLSEKPRMEDFVRV